MKKPVGWSQIRRRLDRCSIYYADKELAGLKILALRYNMLVDSLSHYLEERTAFERGAESCSAWYRTSSGIHCQQ